MATLRAATSQFHRFAEARPAGYTFLFMNMCMTDQSPATLGGMGLHYVNTDSLDGHVNVSAPEALLYEPTRVAASSSSLWSMRSRRMRGTIRSRPCSSGRSSSNEFGLYALHAWVWKDNPSGLFASWNPRVNCDDAGAVSGT